MSPDLLATALIAALVVETIVQAVATRLQVRHQPTDPPPEVADSVDPERYRTAQAYASERAAWGTIRSAYVTVLVVLALATGAFGRLFDAVATQLGDGLVGSLAFVGLVAIALDVLQLPFAVRATFGTEARYGFNRTTPATFVRDKVVGYAVASVLGGGMLALMMASYDWWGRDFWIPFAIVMAVVVVALAAFQTTILLPLFNTLTPLPAGPLRDALEGYAAKVGFHLRDVSVMDGSKRSAKANAFFSGLGPSKKVVLFDTLIDKHPVDEVVAVVAHEVGHARGRHVPKLLLGNVALLTFMAFLASRTIDAPVASWALGSQQVAPILGLVTFVLAFGPVNLALGVLFNAASRRFEFEADAFAVRTWARRPMIAVMQRFVGNELSLTTAHPLYQALNLTHPAPVDRIRAMQSAPEGHADDS